MEILLWLVPPVVVTMLAMAWVGWVGRRITKGARGEADRDEAVRRLGAALEKDPPAVPSSPRPPRERSTGVAVRRPAPLVEVPPPVAESPAPLVEEVAQQPSRDLAS